MSDNWMNYTTPSDNKTFFRTVPVGPVKVAIHLKRLSPSGKADMPGSPLVWKLYYHLFCSLTYLKSVKKGFLFRYIELFIPQEVNFLQSYLLIRHINIHYLIKTHKSYILYSSIYFLSLCCHFKSSKQRIRESVHSI